MLQRVEIKLAKSIEVKENKWHQKNQRKILLLEMEIGEKQLVNVDQMLKEEHQTLEKRKNNSRKKIENSSNDFFFFSLLSKSMGGWLIRSFILDKRKKKKMIHRWMK